MKTSDNYKHRAPTCKTCAYGAQWDHNWFCMKEFMNADSPITSHPSIAFERTWLSFALRIGITNAMLCDAYVKANNFVGTGNGVCDKYEPSTEGPVAHENS